MIKRRNLTNLEKFIIDNMGIASNITLISVMKRVNLNLYNQYIDSLEGFNKLVKEDFQIARKEISLPCSLQSWLDYNIPHPNNSSYKEFWRQILFVRDTIFPMLYKGDKNKMDLDKKHFIKVVGTHISHCINLPVYKIKLKDITIILWSNFHTWKISVKSKRFIDINFQDMEIFDTTKSISNLPCEGFDNKWVYNSFCKDNKKFSCEFYRKVDNNYALYMFFHILKIFHIEKNVDRF